MFNTALVGHSQLPTSLAVEVPVTINIFRSPGAHASNFFENSQLTSVLENRYHLIILWIGSNDITDTCQVIDIARNIKEIVVALENTCGADVRICLIEPRRPEQQTNIELDNVTYGKIAKAVNRKLQQHFLKGRKFISFGAKLFWEDLKQDGVHFRRHEKELFVTSKIKNCITDAYHKNRSWEALRCPVPVNAKALLENEREKERRRVESLDK